MPPLPVRPFAVASLTLLALPASFASAHEDCPKRRFLEPPVYGEGYRASEGGIAETAFAAEGFSLGAWLPLNLVAPGATSGNDCWGYVSPSGREYALMGANNGTSIVEVTDPGNPQILAFIPGSSSLWRDVKVFGTYAYAVTEAGGGIQVIDLSQVDAGVATLVGVYNAGGTGNTHNVAIDEVSGFLYRCGGGSNGLRIYDLNADPVNPPFVGTWPDRYVHDAQIVTYTSGPYAGRQIAFCFSGFNGGSVETGLDILDVTDKSKIVNLSRLTWPLSAYSHQGWLSEDRTLLYALDEQDEVNFGLPSRIHTIEVSDLAAPVYIGATTNGNPATTHNAYTHGDRLYSANYRSGVRVYDLSSPTQPVEVGYFDTYPESDANGYNGCWSVYPYFPSGNLIASDLQRGLFVIRPAVEVAAWSFPEGLPTLLEPVGQTLVAEIAAGPDAPLRPESAAVLLETGSGTETIPMAEIAPGLFAATLPELRCSGEFAYRFRIENEAGLADVEPAVPVAAVAASDAAIDEDDFEQKSGWIVGAPGDNATSGIWVRAIPVGTSAAPAADRSPEGQFCFVTGVHTPGEGAGFNDVDNGVTTLTSPPLDASGFDEPVLRYWRWYSNDAGSNPSSDSMPVLLSNDDGATWIEIELVSENAGQWVERTFRIRDLLEPTPQMRVRFVARDLGGGSLVEAGVDDVAIIGYTCDRPSACPSDLDGNGTVNGGDLGLLLANWGSSGPVGELAGDLDGSGVVDGADLGVMLLAWGACPE